MPNPIVAVGQPEIREHAPWFGCVRASVRSRTTSPSQDCPNARSGAQVRLQGLSPRRT